MKIRNFLVLIITGSFLVFSAWASSNKTFLNDKSSWNTNYTYVFVHGLSGWGHYDSLNNIFPYWGLKNGSLLKELRKAGFEVCDASVAPQGSAWDRACELYAQLTGTVTDYGEEHSRRCGHPRYGRDFSKEPLISQWDAEHKINLIGHSFGGVTVRLLAHLMAEGSKEEQEATDKENLSPLFAGGKADWIYSVTTLASPHNGTSAYHVPDTDPKPKSSMEKSMDKINAPEKDGRADYDYADYDMHIPNADIINQKLKTLENAYYFSYPCSATKLSENGTQEPIEELMEKMFRRSSRRIGAFEGTTPDEIELSKEWQENDGLVNTISAKFPSHAPNAEFPISFDYKFEKLKITKAVLDSAKLEKGIWYVMPVFKGAHMALQGGFGIKTDINRFYLNHLNMINSI
ncbi:MAG: hypothetical protein K6G52_00825 [Treponemataceae bacterium]|nr:hypothetical protein [Treponemataceae bacterium]